MSDARLLTDEELVAWASWLGIIEGELRTARYQLTDKLIETTTKLLEHIDAQDDKIENMVDVTGLDTEDIALVVKLISKLRKIGKSYDTTGTGNESGTRSVDRPET